MTGIALYSPKFEQNWASIMRLAFNFNVDFVCTIGSRYKRQCADTPNAAKSIPTFIFDSCEHFLDSYPQECDLISVEIVEKSRNLETFVHPKNAIYLFGPEDSNIPDVLIDKSQYCVKIDSNRCLNQAMCAGIVLFHRNLQNFK